MFLHISIGTLLTIRQLVPLSRHSALPELQAFVKLFLPNRVVPNTLDPRLLGVDWTYIDRVFASCLHPSARISQTRYGELCSRTMNQGVLGAVALNDCDVALKNLVGNGASDLADKWADDGKLLKKLSFIKSHLGDEEKQLIDKLLGNECLAEQTLCPVRTEDKPEVLNVRKALARDRSNNFARDSEDDTDGDSEDERGRTAHVLFAGLAGIDPEDKENTWSFTSPPSSAERNRTLESMSRFSEKGGRELVHDGAWRLNRLTPISSPIRPPPVISRKVVPSTPKRLPKATQGQWLKTSQLCTQVNQFSLVNDSPPAKCSLKSPIFLMGSSPQGNISKTPTSHLNLHTSVQTPVDSSAPATSHQGEPQWESVKELRKDMTKSNCTSMIIPRKRLQESVDDSYKPKKPCLGNDAQNDSRLAIPSASPSDHTIPQVANQETPKSLLSVPWVRTEREHWHDKRMAMSCKVAEALPHMVAPSYQKKRVRQLAQLERKLKRGLQSFVPMDHLINSDTTPGSQNRKLVPEPTIPSFESTSDDTEEKLDWNRSRMLAEAIREEVAQGRKPTIPLLQCIQSQSQSQLHP
jgi:DNA cross-link repair 1C protein